MIGQLLCRLGHHAPEPDGLWNAGYCFTHCERCGCDMVRSAFGEWHVPRGHRIAWHPPGDGRAHDVPNDPQPEPASIPTLQRKPAITAQPGNGTDPFDFDEFDEFDQGPAGRAPLGVPMARR